MKIKLLTITLFVCLFASAQSVTPNLGLQLPAANSLGWGTATNSNWTLIDSFINHPNGIPKLDGNGHLASGQQVSQLSSRTSAGINYVFEGDSLTCGAGLSLSACQTSSCRTSLSDATCQDWPSQYMLMSTANGRGVAKNIFAVAGNTIANLQSRYTSSVHPLSPAVTGIPGYLYVWVGANDFGSGETAASIESQLTTYWSGAVSDGWGLTVFTIERRGDDDATDTSGAHELIRQQVNEWIRSKFQAGSFNALIDIDRFFENPYDVVLFQSDTVHPTAAGAFLIARYANANVWVDGQTSRSTGVDTAPGSGAGNVRFNINAFTNTASTAINSTAGGWHALYHISTGNYNTGIGYLSGSALTTGGSNTYLGALSGRVATTGNNNTGAGYGTFYTLSSGSDNSVFGYQAGLNLSTTSQNTFIGRSAGEKNTGANNACVGYESCYGNGGGGNGGNNTAIGINTLLNLSTGSSNTAAGAGAGAGVSASTYNTLIGANSAPLTDGGSNTCLGGLTCSNITTGSQNTAIGVNAGQVLVSGSGNEAIGYNAFLGAAVSGAAQIGSGTNSSSNSMQFQSVIVTRVAGAFSTLPACASGIEGSTAPVTDSTTATYAATVTGGGTNHIKAYCNGTNWVVD